MSSSLRSAPGSVLLEQAATRASVTMVKDRGKKRVDICMGVWGTSSFVWPNPRGPRAVTVARSAAQIKKTCYILRMPYMVDHVAHLWSC